MNRIFRTVILTLFLLQAKVGWAVDEVPLQIRYALENSTKVMVALVANKSYECVVFRNYIFDVTSSFRHFFVYFGGMTPSNANMTFTFNGEYYPAVATPQAFASGQSFNRFSYTATESGLHTVTVQDQSGLNTTNTDVSMDCRETTLYGSFNRFFAEVAIIEIENKAFRDIPVAITITDSGGNVLVDKQIFNAKSNTRSDAIFAELPAQSLGQISITHNAPAGALSGTVAEYDFNPDSSITLKRERPLTTALAN